MYWLVSIMAEYKYNSDSSKPPCNTVPKPAFQPEIGRDLCRVEYGGYRKDIVTENLNEREQRVLLCKICQGIMKEACISSSGEQFCLCCKKENSKETPHITVREMINSLKCSCPLIERGCKWLGTLEDCENHLDTCDYMYERCKLECGVVLGRDELRIHENDTCIQRKVRCEHCYNVVKFCDIPKHLKKCPEVVLLCDLCSVEKCRKDMTEHLKDYCLEIEIECPFVKYKCQARMKRKDIDKHLEEKETKHLGLKLTAMEDLITKQREEIDNQKGQIQLLYSITDINKVIWTVKYLMRNNQFVESTHLQVAGYNICFRFRPNRELSIVLPKTLSRHVNSFTAKCHIVLHSFYTINCGRIEVNAKDLTKSCERIITSISQEDIDKYSDSQENLTLEIYLTML